MRDNLTPEVAAIGRLDFRGNVTPESWYQEIRLDSDKAYLEAIVILAEIVYWYRPSETRDESTGQVIGLKKKFKSDKLQRNYQALANKFGFTKRQVANACHYLQRKGLIDLDFRTIAIGEVVASNVLFIGINPDRIEEITFVGSGDTYHFSKLEGSLPEVGSGALKRETNTSITPEITSKITLEINTPLTPKGEEIAANQTSLFSGESQDQKTNPCQNSKSINQDIPLVPPRPPSKPPKLTAEEKAAAKKEKARIADLEFEQFWAIVDYKQGRELAHRRFIALVASGVSAIVLIQKRKEQQDWHDAKSGNSKYLKRPATWLGTDASGWTDEMEPNPIAPQSDSLPTFQPQTNNATERFENQFKNPQRHVGLIESGHGDIMSGKGLLDFEPTLVEVAILHLKKCKLPFEVLDGKRFILNRIRQADWAAIELLKESAATIAGDRQKTEAAIAASVSSDSEYYDTSRYCIPEPPVIDLEARAKATEGGRAKMRETIAQALKNRAS